MSYNRISLHLTIMSKPINPLFACSEVYHEDSCQLFANFINRDSLMVVWVEGNKGAWEERVQEKNECFIMTTFQNKAQFCIFL